MRSDGPDDRSSASVSTIFLLEVVANNTPDMHAMFLIRIKHAERHSGEIRKLPVTITVICSILSNGVDENLLKWSAKNRSEASIGLIHGSPLPA